MPIIVLWTRTHFKPNFTLFFPKNLSSLALLHVLIRWYNADVVLCTHVGISDVTEATHVTNLILLATEMAQTCRMAHYSVDRDKPNCKQQKKSRDPGVPAQLARNMPQEEHTLSYRGGC